MAEVLTPAQRRLLAAIGRSGLRDDFYLTGGTALSAFHLRHRLSVDLDFFTDDPLAVVRAGGQLQEVAAALGATLRSGRSLKSFLGCWIKMPEGDDIKLDFALDTPVRIEALGADPESGIRVDSLADIAANKFSALYDRADGKDFVDVFFLHREYRPIAELLGLARAKHLGIDAYWLSVAYRRVEEVSAWPVMLRPCDLEELRRFFVERAREQIGD